MSIIDIKAAKAEATSAVGLSALILKGTCSIKAVTSVPNTESILLGHCCKARAF